MTDLPFPWRLYAEYQLKAARCDRITDRYWATESSLTRFLTTVEPAGPPQNQEVLIERMNRAIATASWVERNHARLRRKHLQLEQDVDAERRMLARLRLAEIHNSMSAAEWSLLLAVAVGVAYPAMTGMTAGSARTRVARLRAKLRKSN